MTPVNEEKVESQKELLRRLMDESIETMQPLAPEYDYVRQTKENRSDEWLRWKRDR